MSTPNANPQAATPPAIPPVTPAPGTGGTAPAQGGQQVMSQEELEKQAREAKAKLDEWMATMPGLKALCDMFGFGGPPLSATDKAANSIFGAMVHKGITGGVDGLKDFDGTPETIAANLRTELTKMFDKGQLVFDADPAKNQAEFNALLAEVENAVKKSQYRPENFNPSVIMQALVDKIHELGADVTIRLEPKLPPLTQKYDAGQRLSYGEAVTVGPGDMDKIGFNPRITVAETNHEGTMYDIDGYISPQNLTKALGDNFTIQRVQQDGQNHGYFLSNAEGKGYYVGFDALDLEKMRKDAPELYSQLQNAEPVAAPAPAPAAPGPVVAQQQSQAPAGPTN